MDIDSYKTMEKVKVVRPDGVIIGGFIADIDKKKKRLYIRAFGYGLLLANATEESETKTKHEREERKE